MAHHEEATNDKGRKTNLLARILYRRRIHDASLDDSLAGTFRGRASTYCGRSIRHSVV